MSSLISIITPSYNKDKYIAETINSIINQTYKNWELIIVDDVSTDKTLHIINSFQEKDSRIKLFINAENKGANYCRNFGVQKAQGEFVIFLDSDDLLDKECLKNRMDVMCKYAWLDFAVFTMGVFNKTIGDNSSKWLPKSNSPLSDFLQHKLPWQTMQPIWKKVLIESVGGFDTKFERLQDVEFHTSVLFTDGIKFECFNSNPDCYYRIDVARMNYSDFEFLKKWVSSSVKYYNKFYCLALEKKMERKLMGTIYKSYLQILNAYKLKRINKNQFVFLEKELFGLNKDMKRSLFNSLSFSLGKVINLMPLRIKGVNWLIHKLLTTIY